MKILVKYPTRSRPDLFLKTLEGYISSSTEAKNITYLVSYDQDDQTMTEDVIEKARLFSDRIIFIKGKSDSKIQACNRDLENIPSNLYDIILLVSDDMHVQKKGWDQTVIKDFIEHFPELDGCLWYHDGSKQKAISTLTCMGRNYYAQFGYLYHPSYKSFFSDNEYTEVAKAKGKIKFIDNVIIKHEHPNWGGGVANDELYQKNNIHWKHDQDNYNKRKSEGFPA